MLSRSAPQAPKASVSATPKALLAKIPGLATCSQLGLGTGYASHHPVLPPGTEAGSSQVTVVHPIVPGQDGTLVESDTLPQPIFPMAQSMLSV